MPTHRQISLFPELCEEIEIPKPVNVASVPQRSPFRYPGGKTWFVPTFRQWMARMNPKPGILVEPFAGGGIISLTALFEKLVEKAVMVELDDEIASVWESVVNGDAEWLSKGKTYDHAEEVKEMARRHGFQMRLIPMTNTHHAKMRELVIGRDLSWMDRFPGVHEPEGKYRVKKRPNKGVERTH